MKVLVIEDNMDIVETISLTFQIGWPEIEMVSTGEGEKGVELAQSELPDIILLDLGLPDISGFDALRDIRSFSSVPIIILTVMADEDYVIKGLEWGADDYIVKPFNKVELLARMKMVTRRQNIIADRVPLVCGSMKYYPDKRKLVFNDKEVFLTAIEGEILSFLIKQVGLVVPHSLLSEYVWGDDYPSPAENIKVHIRHLREKLETDPSHPRFIITRPGVGYSLVTPE